MIDKKRVFLNALSTVAQVVITSLLYFFLYKLLLNKVGASMLGVWSLIVTTSSIANLANFGITSGLVKFVAEYNTDKNNNNNNLQELVFTSLITLLIFYSSVIVIVSLLSSFILKIVIPSQYLGLGKELLPYSLFCLFINGCGGVFVSVLEGFQKNYLRNIIYSIGSLIFLFFSWLLIDKYGLKAVVYAQILQSLFVFLFCFFSSLKLVGFSLLNSWKWNKNIFKSIFNYGIKFQFISISQMLYDPITKTLIGKFGGLQVLGFYEMASRLVWQIRGLIVNANQIVIPIVAAANKNNRDALKDIYAKSLSLILLVALPLISFIVLFATTISFYWIGHIEPAFTISIYLLGVSMFVNIISGPAYFGCLGEGKLNFVLIVHISMAVINVIMGFLLGRFVTNYGVIWSWALSITAGSLTTIFLYQKVHKIKFKESFPKKDIVLVIAVTVICLTFLEASSFMGLEISKSIFLASITFTSVMLLVLFLKKEILLQLIYSKK